MLREYAKDDAFAIDDGRLPGADERNAVIRDDGGVGHDAFDVAALRAGREIDDHRSGSERRDRLGAHEYRRAPARHLRRGDDDVETGDGPRHGGLLGFAFGVGELACVASLAAGGHRTAFGREIEECRSGREHFVAGGVAHVVTGDDSTEPACRADGLQARDPGAEHQHLRRPHGSGGRHQHREVAGEGLGRNERRLVARRIRLR